MRIQPISTTEMLNNNQRDNNNSKNKDKKETKENNFQKELDKVMKRQYNSIRKRGKQQ